jgi:hypothetical protein
LLLTSGATHAQELGHGSELTTDIPTPDAHFQAQEAIHEGGLHFTYVTTDDPEALPWVFRYRAALQEAGWDILDLNGGGNPFGSPGGAHLRAEHADGRFLRLNAGHPGVQHLDHAPSVSTFIDACVWPQMPQDDTCRPLRIIDTDEAAGMAGDLAAGLPDPPQAEYQSEDVIPEGGRHYHYISAQSHFDVFNRYMFELHEAGWTLIDVATSGDESAGSGAGSASDGSRHLVFSASGGGVITHFDACVWPTQPTESRCPQSTNH